MPAHFWSVHPLLRKKSLHHCLKTVGPRSQATRYSKRLLKWSVHSLYHVGCLFIRMFMCQDEDSQDSKWKTYQLEPAANEPRPMISVEVPPLPSPPEEPPVEKRSRPCMQKKVRRPIERPERKKPEVRKEEPKKKEQPPSKAAEKEEKSPRWDYIQAKGQGHQYAYLT